MKKLILLLFIPLVSFGQEMSSIEKYAQMRGVPTGVMEGIWVAYDGDSHMEKKNYKAAIADYTKAIDKITPFLYTQDEKIILKFIGDLVRSYSKRAYAKNEIGDYKAAIADYTKAIDILTPFLYKTDKDLILASPTVDLGNKKKPPFNPDFNSGIAMDLAIAYSDRAYSKGAIGAHKEAIEDYTIAIEELFYELEDHELGGVMNNTISLRKWLFYAYRDRANAKSEIGDLSGACARQLFILH